MSQNVKFLELMEYAAITAAGAGVIAVLLGQPIMYGMVPVSIALFLNVLNRKNLEKNYQRRLQLSLEQIQEHQDSIDHLSQQLKIAIISLDLVNSQLEENGVQINRGNGSSPNSMASSLKQVSNRITLVEQSITLLQSELEAMMRQFKHRPELEQVDTLTAIIIDLQQFINELPQWGNLQQQQLRSLQERVEQALGEVSQALSEIPQQIEVAIQNQVPGKADKMAEILQKYPRSLTKWSVSEDEELKREFGRGVSIGELARHFQRQPATIRARLQKLGLFQS